MSAAQAIASSRFLTAMGPMIQPLCRPLSIDPDFKKKPLYTVEEYFDGLAKDLGEEFEMNDIREAV